MTLDQLKGVLTSAKGGVTLATSAEVAGRVTETSLLIDVLLALAKAWPDGLDAVAEVMAASGRQDADDHQLFAAMTYLAARLPPAAASRSLCHRRGLQSAHRATLRGPSRRTCDGRRAIA